MAKRRVELGKTGEQVRSNVRRLREQRSMTLADVSARLEGSDRPMALNTISEIENGARRVDTDDLMALAIALQVNPNALLMPPYIGADVACELPVIGVVSTVEAWDWARGRAPMWRRHQGLPDEGGLSDRIFVADVAPRRMPTAAERFERRRVWLEETINDLELDLGTGVPADAEDLREWAKPAREALRLYASMDPTSDADWADLANDPAPPPKLPSNTRISA